MLDKIKTCIRFSHPDDYEVVHVLDDPKVHRQDFVVNALSLKQYNPSSNDKIYFLPECTVPRFKVKQFCEKHNNAVVKYKEKANVIFCSNDTLDELVSTASNNFYYREPILDWFKKRAPKTEAIKQFIVDLANTTSNYIIINYYDMKDLQNKYGIKLEAFLDKDENENVSVPYLEQPHVMFHTEDFEAYKDLCSNQNLYHQNELLYRLNENVITKDEYSRIQDLLKSTDKENIKLVMEIISNCDYRKSAVYLLLLLKDYGSTFWDSETRDHVNFTSLLMFFNVRSRLTRLDLDDILKVLLSHKLLNKINYDIIIPLVIEHINEGNISDYAKVSGIKISDEIVRGIEENVLDDGPDTEIVDDTEEIQPRLK